MRTLCLLYLSRTNFVWHAPRVLAADLAHLFILFVRLRGGLFPRRHVGAPPCSSQTSTQWKSEVEELKGTKRQREPHSSTFAGWRPGWAPARDLGRRGRRQGGRRAGWRSACAYMERGGWLLTRAGDAQVAAHQTVAGGLLQVSGGGSENVAKNISSQLRSVRSVEGGGCT